MVENIFFEACYKDVSSFFSVYIPDFKNVIFMKIPPAPFEVYEIKHVASRLQAKNVFEPKKYQNQEK